MKIKYMIFCILCGAVCTAAPLHAQSPWHKAIRSAVKEAAKKDQAALNRLQERARQSASAAQQAAEEAVIHQQSHQNIYQLTQPVYPAWISPKKKPRLSVLENRFILKSNQRLEAERKMWYARSEKLTLLLQQDHKALFEFVRKDRPTGRDVAERIRPDARYILIGEIHKRKDAAALVPDIILNYREMYPHKQIIVLTEFARASFPRTITPLDIPLWSTDKREIVQKLNRAGVPVAGLDVLSPNHQIFSLYVRKPNKFSYGRPLIYSQKQKLTTTLEGAVLRNKTWIEQLRLWQRQYPDAVFFIYAGKGHTRYDAPGALSKFSALRQNTFVIDLHAEEDLFLYKPEELFPFHQLTKGAYSRDQFGILLWKNNQHARLAGADLEVNIGPGEINWFQRFSHLER